MEKNKLNSSDIRTQKQFLYNLAQIIELFPQYSIAQHVLHFLRPKGDKDPYFWSNESLLKKIEQYYDELKQDLLLNKTEEY